jgi:hypothetical protein
MVMGIKMKLKRCVIISASFQPPLIHTDSIVSGLGDMPGNIQKMYPKHNKPMKKQIETIRKFPSKIFSSCIPTPNFNSFNQLSLVFIQAEK